MGRSPGPGLAQPEIFVRCACLLSNVSWHPSNFRELSPPHNNIQTCRKAAASEHLINPGRAVLHFLFSFFFSPFLLVKCHLSLHRQPAHPQSETFWAAVTMHSHSAYLRIRINAANLTGDVWLDRISRGNNIYLSIHELKVSFSVTCRIQTKRCIILDSAPFSSASNNCELQQPPIYVQFRVLESV